MTHMAPEILLEGRVSKAVDVSEGGGGAGIAGVGPPGGTRQQGRGREW